MATLGGRLVGRAAVGVYEVGRGEVAPSDADRVTVYSAPSWRPHNAGGPSDAKRA